MKSVALTAFPRTLVGRPAVKKLRTAGRIPTTIYGGETKPKNLEVNLKDIKNVLHHSASENVLLDLSVDGDNKKCLALVQEIQHHPLSGQLLHIDLHEVSENEKVTISVPVETTGEAAGVKTGGGVLEHVLFKIKVRALPKDLPEVLLLDVTSLEIGKAIHIGEIPAPAGVEILGIKEAPVIACAAPITEEQEAAATAAAAGPAEVEMTKEKKEEGEAGAAEKAPAKAGEKAPAKGAAEKAPAAAEKGAEKKPAEKKK